MAHRCCVHPRSGGLEGFFRSKWAFITAACQARNAELASPEPLLSDLLTRHAVSVAFPAVFILCQSAVVAPVLLACADYLVHPKNKDVFGPVSGAGGTECRLSERSDVASRAPAGYSRHHRAACRCESRLRPTPPPFTAPSTATPPHRALRSLSASSRRPSCLLSCPTSSRSCPVRWPRAARMASCPRRGADCLLTHAHPRRHPAAGPRA